MVNSIENLDGKTDSASKDAKVKEIAEAVGAKLTIDSDELPF